MSHQTTTQPIQGQLNQNEREILIRALSDFGSLPEVAIEIGTWLGGGSTLHILRTLHENGTGHLWGIEADRSIYDQMTANIERALPEARERFTPLFGFSQEILPEWITEQGPDLKIDFVFLDGGDSPMEQIDEFLLLDKFIPVGGRLLSHDAYMRKGKWFVPYISQLDNWSVQIHDVSTEGLLSAKKCAMEPSKKSMELAITKLSQNRREWIEVIGRNSPRWMLRLAAALLPRRIVRRYAEGRK